VCNAFGVNGLDWLATEGAPLAELRATMGFGVQPLRGFHVLFFDMFCAQMVGELPTGFAGFARVLFDLQE
jgi:hypothetical protein